MFSQGVRVFALKSPIFRLATNKQFRRLREKYYILAKLRLFGFGLVLFESTIDNLHEYIISVSFNNSLLSEEPKQLKASQFL